MRSRLLTSFGAALTLAMPVIAGVVPADTAAAAQVTSVSGSDPDHRLSAHERSILRTDPTARVDARGHLYYVDPKAPARTPTAVATPSRSLVQSEVFDLHSNPDSSHVIFLDVDGATVEESAWPGAGGTYPAWDPADNGPSFDQSELTQIRDIWLRVAEDYAPFDVDVTTADPGPTRLAQPYSSHVLIGPSLAAWGALCHSSCGGVAYIGTFDSAHPDALSPAFVFTEALGPDDTKSVAEAASHEVGHNMGLSHDGAGGDEYFQPAGGLWGPIMGAAYSVPVSQWSQGDYTGAINSEDDVAIIAASTGGHRLDEATDAISTATPLPVSTAYITERTDTDVFGLGECDGPLTVHAYPASVSPDLDIGLTLLDASSGLVATAAPDTVRVDRDVASGMDAVIATSVPAGQYYVRVDGTGSDAGNSVYDDYASLGAYTIDATGCDGVPPVVIGPPSQPRSVTATPQADGHSVRLAWVGPASDGGDPITGFAISRAGAPTIPVAAASTSALVTGLAEGTPYVFDVAALNGHGSGPVVTVSATTFARPTAVRGLKSSIDAVHRSGTVLWQPPASDGGAPLTNIRIGFDGVGPRLYAASTSQFTITGLTPGDPLVVSITPLNSVGAGPTSKVTITMPGAPGAPRIAKPKRGPRGKPLTAVAVWKPPTITGGLPVTGYRVLTYRLDTRGRVTRKTTSKVLGAGARKLSVKLKKGSYRFAVQARNRTGWGRVSARSAIIKPR